MLEKILRVLLIFGSVYFSVDGLIHIFNIKLISVTNSWPQSAIAYAILLDSIYASFIFLAAAIALFLQNDLKKNKTLIFVSSLWAIWHGFLLIFLSFSLEFVKTAYSFPSLYIWLPFYDQYLLFEASLLLFYAALALFWFKNIGGSE